MCSRSKQDWQWLHHGRALPVGAALRSCDLAVLFFWMCLPPHDVGTVCLNGFAIRLAATCRLPCARALICRTELYSDGSTGRSDAVT